MGANLSQRCAEKTNGNARSGNTPADGGGEHELAVRAWDDAGQTQPPLPTTLAILKAT